MNTTKIRMIANIVHRAGSVNNTSVRKGNVWIVQACLFANIKSGKTDAFSVKDLLFAYIKN